MKIDGRFSDFILTTNTARADFSKAALQDWLDVAFLEQEAARTLDPDRPASGLSDEQRFGEIMAILRRFPEAGGRTQALLSPAEDGRSFAEAQFAAGRLSPEKLARLVYEEVAYAIMDRAQDRVRDAGNLFAVKNWAPLFQH